jgi:hypothetical protein
MIQKLTALKQNSDKLILVLRTLYTEEIIKKGTFDKCYEFIKNIEQNVPTEQDFFKQLLEKLTVYDRPSHSSANTERVFEGKVGSYLITLKPL